MGLFWFAGSFCIIKILAFSLAAETLLGKNLLMKFNPRSWI